MLTAGHILDQYGICDIRDGDDKSIGTSWTWSRPIPGRDLAILDHVLWTQAAAALPTLDVEKSYRPTLGEPVLMATSVYGFHGLHVATGRVTTLDVPTSWWLGRDFQDASWGAVAADYADGLASAGAPVLDAGGRVMGVHLGLPRPADGITVFLPISPP